MSCYFASFFLNAVLFDKSLVTMLPFNAAIQANIMCSNLF